MKHIGYFDDFLEENVNLDESRLGILDRKPGGFIMAFGISNEHDLTHDHEQPK